ncbi:unnamed protein product [Aphanomyces euteiches]
MEEVALRRVVGAFLATEPLGDVLGLDEDAALVFAQAFTRQDEEPAQPPRLYTGLCRGSYANLFANVLSTWKTTRRNPLHELQDVPMENFDEDKTSFNHIMAILPTSVDNLTNDITSIASFVKAIGGARGLLTLIGVRCTVGSQVICPPTREQCLEAFNRRHTTSSKHSVMTVGARQWTKHVERSSDRWWGVNKGSEAVKNNLAKAKIDELMDSAVWVNVHGLPNGPVVYEIRQAEGYGARWGFQGNDVHFRGFIEPYLENGHEVGWKH